MPCNPKDAAGKHGRVTQCLADMVPQIPQIQGQMADGIATARYTDEDDPEARGKENGTKNQRKRKTSMQTGVLQRNRVEPLTEVTQNRVYPGPTGNREKTPTKAVAVGTDQLPNTNSLYAGSLLSAGNQASPPPDGVDRDIKALARHFIPDENGRKDTHDARCCAESEYCRAINISGHAQATGRRLRGQNALDEEEIPNFINGKASGGNESLHRVEEHGTLSHPSITPSRGRYQERQPCNERGERPASQNGSRDTYRLPRPSSSRPPPTQNEGSLQPTENVTDRGNKTGKDIESGPWPPKCTGISHIKNPKDTVKLFSDPAQGTFENGAKLGHAEPGDAEAIESLSSIPSLASLTAPTSDSSTDASWTSPGEPRSDQSEQDREQTTLKQCWNTTTHVTLQPPATPCSDDASISHPVQETGTSDLPSSEDVTSSDGSEAYDFRSDPPSRDMQHDDDFVTLHAESGRRGVADRRQANRIQEQSKFKPR